ncbi:MAG: NAD-dependent succinate-semialdehyde dehydrogenase [Bauldia sp.]|uniref:NAD-dependent succinate-semialdehyde dehydrogenase n=1 Tax=Bauldia sp. TaxID=2575872 RepID=UPI001DD04AE0|nr:NAD-dependent succinate-semialdehyde dehydrogenase [Bauldia sp.]MCB1497414.1 NAD-dependent succinate-semialdehyde dehydrogenase [Bauldia sp.]
MFEKFGILIDNEWRPARSGKTMPVHSPATEEKIGDVPVADSEDVADVVASAARGFAAWKAIAAWDRAKVMRRAADLIRERVEDIAGVMSAETGKPLAEARGEANGTADQFEWYAEEAKRVYGQIIPARVPEHRLSVVYQPVGVCLSLSAWNFPALLPSRKIAAALAAGCSVVARPASDAPGSTFKIAEALVDAGIPPGAVTVLTGPSSKLAAELIASPVIRKVSLTGSVAVGRKVLAQCAEGIKRASMELGGHAPVIVHRDADPVGSARSAAMAKFRNSGQVCISPTRFYVHESLKQPFEDAFVDYARSIVVGDGRKDGVTMGPMIRASAVDTALELVEDAVGKGGRLLHGGRRPAHLNKGHFIEPTVIADVPDDARIMVEEPFAPVAPLTTFAEEEELIERANALPFGLAAYVFSNDADRAQRTAEQLEVGMVGINEVLLASAEAPFGGIKESGYGREGGSIGIKDYLEPKFIRHRLLPTG